MNTVQQDLAGQVSAKVSEFDQIFKIKDYNEQLWDLPLEITTRKQLVVVLTTGGPHVEVIAELDRDGEILSASIRGYWGSETFTEGIPSDSAVWRALSEYATAVLDC